jgi:hypothetical protein
MDNISAAAVLARSLFLLNEWRWRDSPVPPSELDIAATFSSLRWELEKNFGVGAERGRTRSARGGRLMVTKDDEGNFIYSVEVGRN